MNDVPETGRPYPRVAIVRAPAELDAALDQLEIPRGRPVVVLIGGASGMAQGEMEAAERTIGEAVGPAAREAGAVVVDGGTDSGVMQLAGRARAISGDGFPLLGVVGRGLVELGTGDQGTATSARVPVEPRHSGIVVVPGSQWGDETTWLFDVAELIARGEPIRTVLVNGGPVTRSELAESLRRSIRVIAIRGTGRVADDLDADNVLDGPDATYDRSLISVAESSDTEGLRSMLSLALRGSTTAAGTHGSEADGAGS
jgi:SLOG in TRPM, prokaryote